MHRSIPAFVPAMFLCVALSASGAETTVRSLEREIPADGITRIVFRDIEHADFVYRGTPDASAVRLRFEPRATGSWKWREDILSRISFETRMVDSTLEVRLIRPDHDRKFHRWLNRGDWRMVIEVSAPARAGVDIDAGFSTLRTYGTRGALLLATSFSDVRVSGHEGVLRLNTNFGNITAENLRGGFDIKNDFGDIDISVAELRSDSRVRTNFGDIGIILPKGGGASFWENDSRDVSFGFCGTPMSRTDAGLRLLNGGGPVVTLDSDMGKIRVSERATAGMAIPDTCRHSVRIAGSDSLMPAPCVKFPRFERGAVSAISVRGSKMCSGDVIRKRLGISVGDTVSRAEVEAAVRKLTADSRIQSARCDITETGCVTVFVREIDAFHRDWDMDASFNRVGGFGLGPRLTITSPVAPLSEVGGYARYNWGPEDWAWGVHAHHDFFVANHLRIGGGYSDDYGSDMDWAIPGDDADLNEFLMGYSSENYFRAEGGNVFVSQSWRDRVIVRAELFDYRYSSVDTTTSWSLFKRDMKKEPNAPLGAASEGWITGMRYSLDLTGKARNADISARIEVERAFTGHSGGYPAYTRVFARGECSTRYGFGQEASIRLSGGYSPGTLPDQRSFRLGGLNTLRGFAPGSVPASAPGMTAFTTFDGGDRIFLVNADYFIGDDFALVLFADAGGVWNSDDAVTVMGIKRDIGAGIQLDGGRPGEHRVRVDCAVPVGNGEVHEPLWTASFVVGY